MKIWWRYDNDNGSDNDNDSPPKPPVIQMREMCRTKREAKHLFLKNPIDSFLLDNSIDAGDPIWRFFHTSISPTPSFLTTDLLQFLNNVFWGLSLTDCRHSIISKCRCLKLKCSYAWLQIWLILTTWWLWNYHAKLLSKSMVTNPCDPVGANGY